MGSARFCFDHGHSAQDVKIGGTQLINVLLGHPDEVADSVAHILDLILVFERGAFNLRAVNITPLNRCSQFVSQVEFSFGL